MKSLKEENGDELQPCIFYRMWKSNASQPPLITCVSLNHCCCTHPSLRTTTLPNANTGLGLPIIISTLSKAEGNAMCDRSWGAYKLPGSWMSLPTLLLWHCLNGGPHDNWDTEIFWAVVSAHSATLKLPLCRSRVAGQEMPVKTISQIIVEWKSWKIKGWRTMTDIRKMGLFWGVQCFFAPCCP